jgi:hypothetical protein
MRADRAMRRTGREATAPPEANPKAQQSDSATTGNELQPDTSGAGAPSAISDGDEQEEEEVQPTIQERHAALMILVKEKRQEKEIRAMEMELAGETPAHPVHIDGTTLVRSKRAASTTLEPEVPRTPSFMKSSNLPSFSGKDLKELRDFSTAWSLHLRTPGAPRAPTDQIALAASYLKGYPAETWLERMENEEPIEEWEKFLEYLRTLIVDPANRMAYAGLQLKEVKQRKGQSVREFTSYIEGLERDIPDWTERERKAWFLLNSLHPDLRKEVMKENKVITSREQVIAAAQRHEELAKQQGSSESQVKPATPRRDARVTHRSRSAKTVGSSGRSSSRSEPSRKDLICFNCGKPGHKSNECRQPKKSDEGGTGASPAQSKGSTSSGQKTKNS